VYNACIHYMKRIDEYMEPEDIENIGFTLKGDDAERFLRWKKAHNIRGNAEAGRKALFDQIDAFESKAATASAQASGRQE
jgi:hypothetical protein